MQVINTHTVSCIYCDDVRREIGGKITVVGMYSESVAVVFPEQGPLVLPKLCFIATVRSSTEEDFKSLRCDIRLDHEIVHSVEVPSHVLLSQVPPNENQGWNITQMIMEMGNISIPRPGILRFSAVVDGDKEYECPGIRFRKASDDTHSKAATLETSSRAKTRT